MLREIITPLKQEYIITIPQEYLHRRVEILVVPLDRNPGKAAPAKRGDILRRTAGILKEMKVDPVKWQKAKRGQWHKRA